MYFDTVSCQRCSQVRHQTRPEIYKEIGRSGAILSSVGRCSDALWTADVIKTRARDWSASH